MHIIRFSRKGACVLVIAVWMSLALLPACSVNVKKQANGEVPDREVVAARHLGGDLRLRIRAQNYRPAV